MWVSCGVLYINLPLTTIKINFYKHVSIDEECFDQFNTGLYIFHYFQQFFTAFFCIFANNNILFLQPAWRNAICRSLCSQQSSLTLCSQEDGIRRIVLNNPKKRNALSLSMLDSLKSNLLHDLDCDLRVIILSANGPVFSSGHDLKELVSIVS